MKTRHINLVDSSGQVYCYKLDEIVTLNTEHFEKHCSKCPYCVGSAGGKGVECLYDDKSEEEEIFFDDYAEAEKHAKYVAVRLGIKTPAEVDATLKSFGAEETDIYSDYEDADVDDTDGAKTLEVNEEK